MSLLITADMIRRRQITEEDILPFLMNYFGHKESSAYYIKMHIKRFVETVRMLKENGCTGKVLELGAYPPYISMIIKKYITCDQYLNCLFKEIPEQLTLTKSVTDRRSGSDMKLMYYNFDVEKDKYPFDDGFFDSVTAFELIEHLKYDPMNLLAEANRVLKHGGRLFMTTPNVVSLRSIHFLINGFAPFYYPKFSIPKSASRHYREYTPGEIKLMMEAAGFEVEYLDTRDVWRQTPEGFDYGEIYREYEKFLKESEMTTELRGEDIYVVGLKKGAVKERFPRSLYEY